MGVFSEVASFDLCRRTGCITASLIVRKRSAAGEIWRFNDHFSLILALNEGPVSGEGLGRAYGGCVSIGHIQMQGNTEYKHFF